MVLLYIYLQCFGHLVGKRLILVFHCPEGRGSFLVFYNWDHCVKWGSGLEITGAVSCSRKAEESCVICSK